MVVLANSCRDLPESLEFCKKQLMYLQGQIIKNPARFREYCLFFFETLGPFLADSEAESALLDDDMLYFAMHTAIHESDDITYSFRHAVLFLDKAIHYHLEGNETKAWINLAESRFHMGIVDCSLFIKITKESKKNVSAITRKGGRNRGSKLDTLRSIFISLLASEKPPLGWQTRSGAVARLLPKASEIYEEKKKSEPTLYQLPNMATTLRNWLKQNQAVRDVYDRHAAATRKQTMPTDNQP